MTGHGDQRWMDAALALARAQLGRTAPNPSVGCIIVKDGMVAGRGATAAGGRPHAERIALDEAGAAAAGATAYVTLEPCAHTGETPPCADALIAAGIGRAVIACGDPDHRTAGQGMARLRAAGIAVSAPLRERQARALNAGFFTRVEKGRPLVVLDRNSGGYDLSADKAPGMPVADWLESLGQEGITRIRLVPGSAAEMAARQADAIDLIVPYSDTPR